MNFKDLKQWEQLDIDIAFWMELVESDGGDCSHYEFPLCSEYKNMECSKCPLDIFSGGRCCDVACTDEWDEYSDGEAAQAMVDRLVEIRNTLYRLDR